MGPTEEFVHTANSNGELILNRFYRRTVRLFSFLCAGSLTLALVLAIALNSSVFRVTTKQQGAEVRIWIQSGWITVQGDCLTLSWQAEGIRELYLDDNGIPGHGLTRLCPDPTDRHDF